MNLFFFPFANKIIQLRGECMPMRQFPKIDSTVLFCRNMAQNMKKSSTIKNPAIRIFKNLKIENIHDVSGINKKAYMSTK